MQDKTLWDSCLLFFEDTLTSQQFNSWIKPLIFEIQGNQIILTAPNSFTLKLVQERFLPEISKQAELFLSCPPRFELRTRDQPLNLLSSKLPVPIPNIVPSAVSQLTLSKHKNQNKLNPLLSFDNFVTGKANQLAHAAAIQVAETPGTTYNPLFIYGGVGLGKTHLIQAIGNHIKHENAQAKICYVHATNYISDVVRAFQTKKFDEFKQFYNSLDLLLIDDIQFIADKTGTQQEFFYTLNSLIDGHKQVVITCDTFPKEISGMTPRLTSRFSWGLTVAVEPPGLEMRVAILLQKAAISNNPISEDVAFFIAKHIRSNIRELEGALKRIDAYSRFHKRTISVELAKEALKDLLASQNKQISIENIQKTVADFYRIKVTDLLSKKRTRLIARPRQIAMCLARELTQLSLPEIGTAFGGRDHTTVMYACKTIESLRNLDSPLNADFNLLNQTLRN
ncbi:MAG: chromosomal replication initiator protein DnaA [Candidatus Nitrotoga sp.]|nr:chromosomal replication initiator protein DnaA [Candidatus Nitrotoga sp.]MDO9448427.1 chromosomal replication initiator protein DnaA [Candidatus Nitrotoga sp.]MDP1638937.1 chromosomal replication initiator protein DnaA [Candidatus Nitrotoga sp.]MDP1854985.1 chromosomal replication initiator protein DnaA [Candidatus Nitrotoga sp.]MDP3496725.1 chromosomal replication initiator protein DnaA [Candidatus Nitrotoga sp.]